MDTETTGLHLDPGKDGDANCKVISIYNGDRARVFYLWEMTWDEQKELMARIMRCDLIMHNAKFDCHMMRGGIGPHGFDPMENVVWDTMIAVRILQPLQPASLKDQGQRWYGDRATQADRDMDAWLKANKKKRAQMWEAPKEVLRPYAAVDAFLTWRLYHVQKEILEHSDERARKEALLEREFMLMKTLYAMEVRGIGFDRDASIAAADKLTQRVEQLRKRIPFKATTDGARRFYFEDNDFVPHELTPKGKAKMDDRAREILTEQNAPHIHTYNEFCKFKQYVSMWYGGWAKSVGRDGRLRPNWTQVKVISMRLSSERANLMAIPHDYRLNLPKGIPTPRQLLIPREGCKLVELDVSQAEIRVATSLAKCKGMRRILEAGEDVHDATTIELFNYSKTDPQWDKYRHIGKQLNFATLYGVGSRGFVRHVKKLANLDITEREAKEFLNLHKTAYPEFVRASVEAEHRARARGFIRLCTGMQRWFADWEQDGLHKAFNQAIQGGVAEVMKDVMIEIEERWPGILLLQVHDSILVELEEGDIRTLPKELRKLMQRKFEDTFHVPFIVDTKDWGKS